MDKNIEAKTRSERSHRKLDRHPMMAAMLLPTASLQSLQGLLRSGIDAQAAKRAKDMQLTHLWFLRQNPVSA